MRLTLRTMLACLDADDRLDPADVEDLGQKIQQSKYATDLATRIRGLVQHPRVGTPRLDAKGNGLDANSVAEYLDNTLPHDRIADFERNCIESDVRLAEVAACHQILVLVLEQPAEIEPAARERMYHLGAESKRQVAEGAGETHAAAGGNVRVDRPATSTPVTPKPAPEVPDYLRAGRRPSLWPLALAALLAFVAVGVGLRLMGPLDRTHPMAQALRGDRPEAPPLVPTDPDLAPVDPAVVPPAVPDQPPPAERVREEDYAIDIPVEERPAEPPPEPDMLPVPPPLDPDPVPDPTPPVTTVQTDPMPEPAPTVEPVEPPQPAADIGRFVSEDQVLVRYLADQEIARVPARGSLFAGDALVVFPAYRPQLLLANNVQVTMAGESRLAVGAIQEGSVAAASIEFGRLLAVSVGKPNARLALQFGKFRGFATLATVDSEMAVEVRHYLPPGSNPQTPGNTVPVVRLYALRGTIQWQEGTVDAPGDSFEIESGSVRNYVGESAGETVKMATLPDWVDGRNIADIDRRAARELEDRLRGMADPELVLQEAAAASERKAEVRSLAIRSLALLDQYEPFVAALNDETQRAYWPAQYDALRDALARDPETAVYIQDIFVKIRGEQDGRNLYRMLWGFSPEDLKSGFADELVKSLDVEPLDYRVLAFENLRRITGSTQLYQPQFPAARRRAPVAQWRERLKAGEIAYKTPPAPITDPRPTTPAAPRSSEPALEP